MTSKMRWLPLESNPDVMNKYAKKLGLPSAWQFVDVFGLEPELLAMIPRPVVAVLLLYPTTAKAQSQQIGEVKSESENVYFIKQTIGNACGTMAIIHTLANNAEKTNLDKNGVLSAFLEKTKSMSAEEKAKALESEEGIGAAHEESALEGQTEVPPVEEKVNLHFVAFVESNGSLYELDGRKSGPTCHGKSSPDTLLEDTVAVARLFMKRDPTEVNFSLVALAMA